MAAALKAVGPKADVFDLDALEVEGQGRPFPFRHAGRDYTLPALGDVDWRLAPTIEADAHAAMRALLGDEEYEHLVEQAMPIKKSRALMQAYLKAQGLEPGELPASTDSSGSTGPQ